MKRLYEILTNILIGFYLVMTISVSLVIVLFMAIIRLTLTGIAKGYRVSRNIITGG